MASYILRNIDPALWALVKAKAEKEGHPLRWLFLNFLRHYVEQKEKGR